MTHDPELPLEPPIHPPPGSHILVKAAEGRPPGWRAKVENPTAMGDHCGLSRADGAPGGRTGTVPSDGDWAAVPPEGDSVDGEEILRGIVTGDPLGVRAQVARRLRERCLLLDPHVVCVQVFATLATQRLDSVRGVKAGQSRSVALGLDRSMNSTVDRVIDDMVAGRLGLAITGFPRGGILVQLARALKVNQIDLKRACERFNRLPADARRAFHALILQRRSLESACRRSASAAESWSSGALRGMSVVLGGRMDSIAVSQPSGTGVAVGFQHSNSCDRGVR